MPTIRPATHNDIPAITEIFNEAGVGTTASYTLEPVSVADRRAWFERLTAEGFPVLVVEDDGVVAGYASYGQFRSQGAYRHTVEHSIYIASGHRTGGLGRMLMNALVDVARGNNVHAMVGVVDGANQESIAFHERLGFVASSQLPEVGRKFDRWLDVVFVTRVLS
ncbi:phosphinothricin acetyltransferase [Tessaracoccus bendigoensis DSM 12906]|uniref:Phosphinothricin acetyltransferase n=1 Tax=Tessaracoccus bendigoensis DSM 12906 TaxID=1123357 RepID=A0A1M6F098_9ACTN|nr:GNAT family N-acetyltransferase [Tessaracoccus bendigoensis]SHI91164.1 phosphinothricin acetyltransferase [Tessaracoccus bendigoensis DSM 12906]